MEKQKLPTFAEYTYMTPEDKAAIPRAAELMLFSDPQFLKDQQKAQREEFEENTKQAAQERADIVAGI